MKKFLAIFAVAALVAFAAPAFAATNPFMDVPAGHWAYDAVAQLASRGVASGYPDGSYKGTQPATRYEMASMVGRILAGVDVEKASKQDVELLKRLVLEFKNELDALGVKVNDLDKRVAVLEDGLGAWKIRGMFVFDAKFTDTDKTQYTYNDGVHKNEFTKERFRLFLTKSIDEKTFFFAQYRTGGTYGSNYGLGDQNIGVWAHLYVDTELPWDTRLRVGRFVIDFEGDYGFYNDNDASFGDYRTDGFRLKKSFGIVDATAIVARNSVPLNRLGATVGGAGYTGVGDHMLYILDLHVQPNEKFFFGATGYWAIEDSYNGALTAAGAKPDIDFKTYGFYAAYKFTPNIALKGMYYFQDLDRNLVGADINDSPNTWKAIIDIKQPALKFTSLWVEYMNMNNAFLSSVHTQYSIGGNYAPTILYNQPLNDNTTKVLFVKAEQKWNNKWGSFLRFAMADFDTAGLDKAYEYGVGLTYRYSPSVAFELAYDLVDYGSNGGFGGTRKNKIPYNTNNTLSDKESMIRFRTAVFF